jgi:hypothetical protein
MLIIYAKNIGGKGTLLMASVFSCATQIVKTQHFMLQPEMAQKTGCSCKHPAVGEFFINETG